MSSSAGGHLAFHFLTFVKTVAVNMGMWVSPCPDDFISFNIYAEVELLDHIVTSSILSFCATSILFSIMAMACQHFDVGESQYFLLQLLAFISCLRKSYLIS